MRDLLLLCNRPAHGANAETIIDHLDALNRLPGFRVFELSMVGAIPDRLDLGRFDVIGIHYSLHLSDVRDHFLSRLALERIARFKGLKCVWLHDEYRNVNAVVGKLRLMEIDIVFSLANPPEIDVLYPKSQLPHTRLETVLAGYVPRRWKLEQPLSGVARPIDVGYRARRPPMWLGSLAQEKIDIGLGFIRATQGKDLNLDISVEEHDRLYGSAWPAFLKRCRTVLCVESGASIIDFTGDVEKNVEETLRRDRDTPFSTVHQLHLAGIDGRHVINPVSPRVFEAAAMRTVMICFEGKYSGLMTPWEHYIPLRKDFSNLDEVVQALQDDVTMQRIADNAYRDLVADPRFSYQWFAQHCAAIMAAEILTRHCVPADRRYNRASFFLALSTSPKYLFRRYVAQHLQALILGTALRRHLIKIWYGMPRSLQSLIKPALKIIGR
jgi:hypothetical protein